MDGDTPKTPAPNTGEACTWRGALKTIASDADTGAKLGEMPGKVVGGVLGVPTGFVTEAVYGAGFGLVHSQDREVLEGMGGRKGAENVVVKVAAIPVGTVVGAGLGAGEGLIDGATTGWDVGKYGGQALGGGVGAVAGAVHAGVNCIGEKLSTPATSASASIPPKLKPAGP